MRIHKYINVPVSEEVKKILKEEASRRDMTMAQYMMWIVKMELDYLKVQEKKNVSQ
jgi:hypothetical protein